MRFRTTINIIAEAQDKNEAMEIAGEYLSGNLTSGVEMKFHTAPVRSNGRAFAGIALAVALIFGLSIFQLSHIKHSQSSAQNLPGENVIQPPLATSPTDRKHSDFRKEWQARHAQEALNYIKR
jgi:hypothetical protein